MIDFRYHLVSLISVFLALAVGIVLGAGPLQDSLGDQLSGQVEQLRTEQENLRSQVEDLEGQNDQLASLVTEIGPEVVAGTLEDSTVAVITDDASTGTAVDTTTSLLQDAGAATVVEVELQRALWAPDRASTRADALEEIAAIAPAVLDPELEDHEQLAAVVVDLLAPASASGLDENLRGQIWQVLVQHQLVSTEGDIPVSVDALIYAAAEPERFAVATDDDATATERAQQQLAAQTALLEELAGTGMPAVVAGVTPDNDGTTGLLRTVRGDGRFGELSSTDRLQEPDGPLLAVLALIEQDRGGSGAYGTTSDAESRLPSLPETQASAPAASDGGEQG